MVIGYIRASKNEQNRDLQFDALKRLVLKKDIMKQYPVLHCEDRDISLGIGTSTKMKRLWNMLSSVLA